MQPISISEGKPDLPVILHLEDDAQFSEMVSLSLADCATMRSAQTLEQAIPLLDGERFELVIIDWDLPHGEGSVLLDRMGAMNADTAVIGLSAFDQPRKHPRVIANFVKSRMAPSDLVSQIKVLIRQLHDAELADTP